MPISFACPCGMKFNIPDFNAGFTFVCPSCGGPLTVPPANTDAESNGAVSPAPDSAPAANMDAESDGAGETPPDPTPDAGLYPMPSRPAPSLPAFSPFELEVLGRLNDLATLSRETRRRQFWLTLIVLVGFTVIVLALGLSLMR